MRPLILLFLAACGPAEASDLWLNLDHRGTTDTIRLHLPANWLTEADEPVWIDTEGGRVDLRTHAVALKAKESGASERWTLKADDPITVELQTLTRTGDPATSLGLQTRGPKGNGLTATMALTPDQLGETTGHLGGVVDINGLKFDLDKAMCDQLKASPPVTLLETTGPKGGGLTIDTR